MKKCTALRALFLLFPVTIMAQQVSETKQGLRVDPAGDKPTTEVMVYAPNIIRVTKYADGLEALPDKKSYSVIMTPEKGKGLWRVEGTTLTLVAKTTVDGIDIIEAVERQDKTFCLGVQFHPENDLKLALYDGTPEKALCDLEVCMNFFDMLISYAAK